MKERCLTMDDSPYRSGPQPFKCPYCKNMSVPDEKDWNMIKRGWTKEIRGGHVVGWIRPAPDLSKFKYFEYNDVYKKIMDDYIVFEKNQNNKSNENQKYSGVILFGLMFIIYAVSSIYVFLI